MKYLLDENLSSRHTQTFRSLGRDAVSVVEIGLGGADDAMVRAAAIEGGRVLVTLDGDFANMLRFPPSGTPGVLRFRLHPATEEAINAAIGWVVTLLAETDVAGKLVVVDEKRIRIRG